MIKEDFEEIEKMIKQLKDNLEDRDFDFDSVNNTLMIWINVKETFVTENLKRINETIYKNEFYTSRYGLNDKSNFKQIHQDLVQLKADKIFLEEKNA